ncbi:MAG: CRISPR-associated helicase Cas3', partial [Lachnospiraceae bacterium]|nr:CRISPR-associated helicase Cas3' [Lachnospiraceae bacterium]
MKYLAHISEDGLREQTVEEHCKETAELSKMYARNIHAENIAYLQAILHDIGKVTEQFNEYIRGENNLPRGSIDHSYAGAKYICEKCDLLGDDFYEIARFVARTIISHHGLYDWIEEDGSDYLRKRINKSENYEEIFNYVQNILSDKDLEEMVKHAKNEYDAFCVQLKRLAKVYEKGIKEAYAFYMGLMERLMQSVLIDADRTNTSEFMMNRNIGRVYDSKELFSKLRYRYENVMLQKKQGYLNQNMKIVEQRTSISERCASYALHQRGICQLIVPTGGGKTLSSLRFAIEYCCQEQYEMERIFYIAPFVSILEQNSRDIRDIVGSECFLEHHSNVAQNMDRQGESEELQEYELYTEKWDTPVIATTMVQFLNTLFSARMSSVRRFHNLCRSVIIIDEAQAIPLKCVNMFHLAMNFLKEMCGSTIVLCSATQPDYTACRYPLLLDKNPWMIGDCKNDFEIFRRTKVVSCLKPEKYTYDQAAEFCYDRYKENGSLLLIVNTKKSALVMYEKLNELNQNGDEASEKAEIIHLSTNMCPKHREEAIGKLRLLLCERKKVICVATQLIEAGVDLSFRCVVRALAGMDNIVQAAGRCNRNAESYGLAPVYIINFRDERLGNLRDIRNAQELSIRLLGNKEISDYLSVDTMNCYFQMLYKDKEYEQELSYKITVDGIPNTLLNLLSRNSGRWSIYKEKKLQWHAQAFKTAGNLFEVIDKNAVDVIVPYNEESRDIILQLHDEMDKGIIWELLRKAQLYTVSMYMGTHNKYDSQGALTYYSCGAFSLADEF